MTSPTPWAQWIDSDTIHSLYAEGISQHGGFGSPSKDGCIDGALGGAYTAELYSMPEMDSETVVSGLCFCGYLLFYIASKHCFVDGNKRVAWSSTIWVLGTMGLTIDAPDEDVINYVLSIAAGEVANGEEVVNWIADRVVQLELPN
jgi:death on curing protein